MNNFNINRTFCSVFVVVVLILFALTFVFWLGYRTGSSTVKSEVLWSHGDFSNTETSVVYADPETEITGKTNNKSILVNEVLVESGTEYMTWISWVCPHCHNSSIHWLRLEDSDLSDGKSEFIFESKEEEIELSIEEPEQILIEFTSTGEWKDTFKPSIFIKITDTDLSKCFVEGRLKLDLNSKIYWIRLEED